MIPRYRIRRTSDGRWWLLDHRTWRVWTFESHEAALRAIA